ncbi:MAG: PatB family C-S lyase [Rikenellaceae bacterium]
MIYDFNKVVDRQGTFCEKYDHRSNVFGSSDIIPMWIADMDFETPPFIMEAIRERTNHNFLGYSFRGTSYHDAITSWLFRRSGWVVDPSTILFTPGSMVAVSFAIDAFTNKGDNIVIQPPVYGPFSWVVEFNERRLERNLLKMDEVTLRSEIDFEDLDRRLAKSKIFLFCSPHNPTGRVFTHDELQKVADLCIKHNVIIVSDEMHCDIIHKPHKFIHISSISEEVAARCITIVSGSKTFNMAGLSTTAVVIPNKELRDKFFASAEKAHINQGNLFGSVALEAAFTYGDEWLDQMLEYLGGTIDYVLDFVAKHMPEVKCYRPESTYMIWFDFRAWGMTHSELREFMVAKAKIGFTEGEFFGKEGSGYMRMNIAAPRSIVEKAMHQLYQASLER